MIGVRDGGALRRATEIRVRTASGLATVEQAMARGVSGLAEVYRRGLRLAANPTELYATSSPRAATSTSSVSVSVSGGTGPYTHNWSAAGSLAPTNPTGATTAFRIPRAYSGSATATDTVTDALGLTASVSLFINVEQGSDGSDLR